MLQRKTESALLLLAVAVLTLQRVSIQPIAAATGQQRGTGPAVLPQPVPSDQTDWRGWARCQVDVQGNGYVDQQIHTWVLAGGTPRIEGAFRVYPATWSVVGGGWMERPQGVQTRIAEWATNVQPMPAPLALVVRASDGRLLITARHAQLRSSGAMAGYDQMTGVAAPQPVAQISGTAFETAFPAIEADAAALTLAGSSTPGANGSNGYLQPAGSQVSMACTWQFGQGASAPMPPPYLEARAVPTPRSGRGPRGNRAPTAVVSGFPNSTDPGSGRGTSPAVPPKTAPPDPGDRGRVPVVPPGTVPKPPADPGVTLTPVTPTGPPPPNFTFNGDGWTVQLSWGQPTSNPLDSTVHLYRSIRPLAATEIPLPRSGFWEQQPTSYRDDSLEPGAYAYRLIVNYKDGRWGEATASHTAPPFKNPSRFRATVISPDSVKLEWDSVPLAEKYRIDGSTFPVTGKEVNGTELIVTPFRGQGMWQIAAFFPGGRADFTNRPVATTLAKPVPAHAPAYLSKSNGPGSEAQTAEHYSRLCNYQGRECATFESYLSGWGVELPIDKSDLLKYNNETDLGGPRQTRCVFGQPSKVQYPVVDRSGALICWSNSLGKVSLIVMTPEGARFAVFKTNQADPNDTYGPGATVTLVPTAIFDSEGPKNAPHACLACHGGTYDPTTKLVKGASLLPIDPSLVHLEENNATSQERIRIINSMIRQTYSSPAVSVYIDGLYGGMDGNRHKVDQPGTQAIANFVPSGWNTQRSLYLDFVKKDCAMCHLAGPPYLNFLSAGNFLSNKDLIHTAVCRARSMPHAETSFLNFWTRGSGSVSGPGWFAAALGFSTCNAN